MTKAVNSKATLVRIADERDREEIYRLRHEVYGRELGQFALDHTGASRDILDDFNSYIVCIREGSLAGFISITPPGHGCYSVDKYVCRENFPELGSDRLFEIRLLTISKRFRARDLAALLMYAAHRWIESQGGEDVVAIGRRELLPMYLRVGMESAGYRFTAGKVRYELLRGRISGIHARLKFFAPLLNRMERNTEWRLEFPFRPPTACFHGGAFFSAIGPEFDRLERRRIVINADVLDAWFPPTPGVVQKIDGNLPWLLQTSPPTACEGLVQALSRARGVPARSVLPVGGSSDGIYLALRHWLTSDSRVLLLDPCYGEYSHLLEQVIRCRVDRIYLSRSMDYQPDLDALIEAASRSYDLIVIINPNSPTGRHVPRAELERVLESVARSTRVWIDETYVDYVGASESLEQYAASSRNVVVCKSMSKVYALSGARVGYLCGPSALIDELAALNPPWAAGLVAQVAAVAALQDPAYYARRYAETHRLREELADQLRTLPGWSVVPGSANFLLCHLGENGPDASTLIGQCRARGLFLRDAASMGRRLGNRAVRVAVKDAATNDSMLGIFREVLGACPESRAFDQLAGAR